MPVGNLDMREDLIGFTPFPPCNVLAPNLDILIDTSLSIINRGKTQKKNDPPLCLKPWISTLIKWWQ